MARIATRSCFVKERVVPTINFVREGKKVQVEVGESLRYAALDNDIPLYQEICRDVELYPVPRQWPVWHR